MNYLARLSCASLSEHFAMFHNEEALDELKKRDAEGKTDKQLFLEFASPDNLADTSSVESPDQDEIRTLLWEAYESGFEAGKKVGEKNAFAEAGFKVERVL